MFWEAKCAWAIFVIASILRVFIKFRWHGQKLTKGPTTTTEVRDGMNFCDPLMKILKSDKMKSVPRNGYEINFVICEAHEICQPLSNKGDLAEIGYSFLNLLKDSYRNGRNIPTLTFENLKPLEIIKKSFQHIFNIFKVA